MLVIQILILALLFLEMGRWTKPKLIFYIARTSPEEVTQTWIYVTVLLLLLDFFLYCMNFYNIYWQCGYYEPLDLNVLIITVNLI